MGTIVKYHTKVVFGFEDRIVPGGISHLTMVFRSESMRDGMIPLRNILSRCGFRLNSKI